MRSAPPIAARNAAQESEARDARLLRRARDLHVRHRRAGADAVAFHRDLVEAAAEPDHHARHAAVAHDQVGAEPDDRDRNFGGKVLQEISEVVLVLRHEQNLRRPADAKPGQLAPAAGWRAAARAAAACLDFRSATMSGKLIAVVSQRLQFARQRIGPLRDVAGAEADHDVAGLRHAFTIAASCSGSSSAITWRWPRARRPCTSASRSVPAIGASPAG